MHTQLKDIPGRMVLDATGSVLGRIKAPLVDLETWSVDGIRVALTRHAAEEMGLVSPWWKRATMDVSTGLVYAAGEAIILRVSLGELRDALPRLEGDPVEAMH